jgi:hypothetical protein
VKISPLPINGGKTHTGQRASNGLMMLRIL